MVGSECKGELERQSVVQKWKTSKHLSAHTKCLTVHKSKDEAYSISATISESQFQFSVF